MSKTGSLEKQEAGWDRKQKDAKQENKTDREMKDKPEETGSQMNK